MEHEAAGPFEVTLTPAGPGEGPIGRMSIAKRFAGELEGTSVGQMLMFGDPAGGSAGYVAMERVSGRLGGREGSFTLQHSGLMDAGVRSSTVVVVPGSGTDALSGLAGTMEIEAGSGGHAYRFRYTLPISA